MIDGYEKFRAGSKDMIFCAEKSFFLETLYIGFYQSEVIFYVGVESGHRYVPVFFGKHVCRSGNGIDGYIHFAFFVGDALVAAVDIAVVR